jgi:hypothetical protein
LNAQGQTLWTSQYGGELDDVGSVVEETQDGGFLCGGYATINIHSQETDFVLWKVAVNGDSLWSASYGGVSNESCSSLQQLEGGSFVAAGGTFSFGEGLYDFYLVRLAAEATPVLTADPPALNFGTRWVDDDSIAAVTLTNSGSEHLSILSAENLDWAIFNVLNFQPVELAPGTSTQFDVRFLPHWAGEFTADTVRVSFDHEDSPLLIPLTGTGAHFDFYPEFTSINFGYNQQDPVHSEDIEFANDGDSIVTITGISLSEHDDFFSFSPQILTAEPGESATLTVVMDATGFPPASYSAELCLQYDQWQDGELCIPVIADLVPPNAAGDVNQPLNYSLSPAYPNPFNPSTTISFGLPQAADVRLTVYDITGREVTTLANARMDAGYHTVEFSAAGLPSGVYLCRLHAGEFSAMRKLVLMK